MTFNVWTFLFEVLNFVVLAAILHRLLYRPLREAIDSRKAENARVLAEAEAARKTADAVREQLAAKLAETDHERQEVLRKAAELAEAESTRRLAEADVAAKSVREQARRSVEHLRQETLAGLEGEIGGLAVGLAERLLTQACDASLNVQLARRLIETVEAIPESAWEQIRRDAGHEPPVVESTVPLEEPIRNALIGAIHKLLGQPCEVRFELNSSLVGGARLRVGGHVWDASAAGQLEVARQLVGGAEGVNQPTQSAQPGDR